VLENHVRTLQAVPDDGSRTTFEQYSLEWIEPRRVSRKLDWKHHERRLRLHAYLSSGECQWEK